MQVVHIIGFSCTGPKNLSFTVITQHTEQHTVNKRMLHHVIIISPNTGQLEFLKFLFIF